MRLGSSDRSLGSRARGWIPWALVVWSWRGIPWVQHKCSLPVHPKKRLFFGELSLFLLQGGTTAVDLYRRWTQRSRVSDGLLRCLRGYCDCIRILCGLSEVQIRRQPTTANTARVGQILTLILRAWSDTVVV
eukprot:422848-Amorphochlora_amoeboformis.AAC.3